jgi:hypothetical protein
VLLDSRDSLKFPGSGHWLADGFFAQAFQDSNNNIIISFEGSIIDPADPSFGTDYAKGSRAADLLIRIGLIPKALLDAEDFALATKQYLSQHNLGSYPIYLTGHSEGGTEAQDVAWIINPGGTRSGVTFGAPGDPSLSAPLSGPDFVNYVDWGDPIGNFGNHFGTVLHTGPFYDAVAKAALETKLGPVFS